MTTKIYNKQISIFLKDHEGVSTMEFPSLAQPQPQH